MTISENKDYTQIRNADGTSSFYFHSIKGVDDFLDVWNKTHSVPIGTRDELISKITQRFKATC